MRLAAAVFFTALAVLTAGCASKVTGSALAIPQADLDSEAPWYVLRHRGDGRDLAADIAITLRERGILADSGYADAQPDNVRYVVHVEDRWSYDMRIYLGRLRIEVKDAATGRLLGWGESRQRTICRDGTEPPGRGGPMRSTAC